jgi:hypothetical protein
VLSRCRYSAEVAYSVKTTLSPLDAQLVGGVRMAATVIGAGMPEDGDPLASAVAHDVVEHPWCCLPRGSRTGR